MQPVALAGVLHQPDDLPGQPFAAQLGGDVDFERRRSRRRLEATVQPERGVWVTISSSGPSGTGAPSTMTETFPAERSSAASTAGSAAPMAAATGWVPLPNRCPSDRKFGFTT